MGVIVDTEFDYVPSFYEGLVRGTEYWRFGSICKCHFVEMIRFVFIPTTRYRQYQWMDSLKPTFVRDLEMHDHPLAPEYKVRASVRTSYIV